MVRIPVSADIICKERMGGRKKVYTNLDALAAKESVRRWIEGLTEGHSGRHAIYSVNRFVIWRRSRGLEADPDRFYAAGFTFLKTA